MWAGLNTALRSKNCNRARWQGPHPTQFWKTADSHPPIINEPLCQISYFWDGGQWNKLQPLPHPQASSQLLSKPVQCLRGFKLLNSAGQVPNCVPGEFVETLLYSNMNIHPGHRCSTGTASVLKPYHVSPMTGGPTDPEIGQAGLTWALHWSKHRPVLTREAGTSIWMLPRGSEGLVFMEEGGSSSSVVFPTVQRGRRASRSLWDPEIFWAKHHLLIIFGSTISEITSTTTTTPIMENI